MRSALIRKLDGIFSEFIRRRDADKNGVCRCCTCGTMKPWKEMHAGHFVGREARNTRWEEQNVHAQCPSCNTFHEGRKPEYALFLMEKYGPDIVFRLVAAGKRARRFRPIELEALILHYQEELVHLSKAGVL
jgi:hypothetical protein